MSRAAEHVTVASPVKTFLEKWPDNARVWIILQTYVSKLQHKLRNRLFLYWLFDQFTNGLSRLGLTLWVYILYREGVIRTDPPILNLDDCTWGFAEAATLPEIARVEGYGQEPAVLAQRLAENSRCFVLRHGGQVVAFTWCQLGNQTRKGLDLRFGPKDAYLFDAYTAPTYRGLNILPFLRYHIYPELRKMGRTNYFSVTEVSNKPARRFKGKLAARPMRISVYLALFKRIEWTFTIYRFDSDR